MLPLTTQQSCYHLIEKEHNENVSERTSRQGSVIKEGEKNPRIVRFSDIFSYQTLNTKLLKEKRKRCVCEITLNHYLSQKSPLNIIYYMHMWVILERNVTFTRCPLLWQTTDDSITHGMSIYWILSEFGTKHKSSTYKTRSLPLKEHIVQLRNHILRKPKQLWWDATWSQLSWERST